MVTLLPPRRRDMGDLKSKRLIVIKGSLFLALSAAAAGLILLDDLSVRMAALLALLVWSSCRFYYFLFYVLEKYVDANLRYAGLLALIGALRRRHRGNPPP
jgi:hypothetical protein